ncbi:MAG: hypothetical protein WA857_12715 [Candidatus Acidiferrum sp.]
MAKAKTDNEKILAALEDLHTRIEDLFVLEASRAGIGGHQIRAILGIDMARVTRIAKYVKKGE